MKIAITTYNDRISNVFDFAHKLLLIEEENGAEISRSEVLLFNHQAFSLLCKLKELEVDVLICGAISKNLGNMIIESGIQLFPYITGRVEDVLNAYLSDNLVNPEFSMPGRWQGAGKCFGNCKQRGRSGDPGHQWRGGRDKRV
jgi:predicted Fe-Mo cluster-binding NifX family protein